MQRSTTLTSGSWASVAQLGPLTTPGTVILTDPNPPLAGTVFYRLVIVDN